MARERRLPLRLGRKRLPRSKQAVNVSGFQRLLGTAYDLGAQWKPSARLGAWLEWGADLDPMYLSMSTIAHAREGSTVLDVPCGGGMAFRALDPKQRIRYIAADASPTMLRRARARAQRKGLTQIEITHADVGALPLPSESVELCVSYNGIQCFPDPAAAVAELSRCLCPGGTLLGTTVVTGERRRSDRAIEAYRALNAFGPGGTKEDLARWLKAAGFIDASCQTSGALTLFRARKPDGAGPREQNGGEPREPEGAAGLREPSGGERLP